MTRRVWVTQQARRMVWQLEDREPALHFLIHDRDTKFGAAFDTVFQSIQAHIIRIPFRAPNAYAYAARWVRTLRQACLNKLFILNEAHLRRVLNEYVTYITLRARTRELLSTCQFQARLQDG